MSPTLATIGPFTGEHRWLSNFFPCLVRHEGMEFRSVEHAYQAAKATDRVEKRMVQIQPKAGDAKRVGRRLRSIRADWDQVKVGIMRELVAQKFLDPQLRSMLIATGDDRLVEHNTWHDNFWGWCTCGTARCAGALPQNVLGLILMETRLAINAEGPF